MGPLFLLFGVAFGFVLARGRVTNYDVIGAMFRFTEFHLFGVIGAAIGTSALGLWLLRRRGGRTLSGQPWDVRPKPWQAGAVWGGLVLGAGWGLTGACPGTSLVQIGEGRVMAFVTVAGILTGTWLYGRLMSRPGTPPVIAGAREAVR